MKMLHIHNTAPRCARHVSPSHVPQKRKNMNRPNAVRSAAAIDPGVLAQVQAAFDALTAGDPEEAMALLQALLMGGAEPTTAETAAALRAMSPKEMTMLREMSAKHNTSFASSARKYIATRKSPTGARR
jgi:hypothetical protein